MYIKKYSKKKIIRKPTMELESRSHDLCENLLLLTDPDIDKKQESSASERFQASDSQNLGEFNKSFEGEDDEAAPLRPISKGNNKYDKNGNRNHPGVILLGRGNSFSLGRSEVIVLNRKLKRTSSLQSADDNNEYTPSGCSDDVEVNNNNVVGHLHASTPPPISNGGSEELLMSRNNLDLLWAKAESVMFAKQEAVQSVLEDFGIGEAGGRGEEDHNLEEENVWQVVQENFQV